MPPGVEITVPTSTTVDASKPYTIYDVTIRLPLRSFVIQKRYSDFVAFHDGLVKQAGAPPPVSLPGKSWFSSTNSNPTLRDERRQGLERYLQAINEDPDSRWRNTTVWRAFLNLPSAAFGRQDPSKTSLREAATNPAASSESKASVTDPVLWLDYHREVKQMLHDARLHLTRRDQATTPQKQHESSALAKASLVKVGSMITALEDGLQHMNVKSGSGSATAWGGGGNNLGEGEIRRRKDLIANARKEKDGLENLHSAMITKNKPDQVVASVQDKDALIAGAKPGTTTGRVLGRETDKTRALDNEGVLQLQKQIMQHQDLSVDELRKIVARQKELGVAINDELEVQQALLDLADEDVDRYVIIFLYSLQWYILVGFLVNADETGYKIRLQSEGRGSERYLKTIA
jgi:regulator of vacuolar morphogenesis